MKAQGQDDQNGNGKRESTVHENSTRTPSDALGPDFKRWVHKGDLVLHVGTVVPPGAHGVPVDGEVRPDAPPVEHHGPGPAGHGTILSLLFRPRNGMEFQDFHN